MQVTQTNLPAFRSLIGYYVTVLLRPAGSQDWDDIGSIGAYGFSRPTAQHPDINLDTWRTEWLRGTIDETKYANGTDSIARALRAIYRRNGTVRSRIGEQFRAQLANDGTGDALIYIAQLCIRQQNAAGDRGVSSLTHIVWNDRSSQTDHLLSTRETDSVGEHFRCSIG